MLERSFVLLPGIGPTRERRLWQAGILTWDAYLAAPQVPGVSRQVQRGHGALVRRLIDARLASDNRLLADLMPSAEHWRFFDEPAPRAACLDIETTGTHRGSPITVVGVYDPLEDRFHALVRGEGLDHESLRALLDRFDMYVTFNGNGFDLPLLRHQYPGAIPDLPHLDLRGALARLGYKGGLKRIEIALGLERPDEVRGVDGYEAVLLWRRYKMKGDVAARDRLVAYNREDCVNLFGLARFAAAALYNQMAVHWNGALRRVHWPSGAEPPVVSPELAKTPGVHLSSVSATQGP